MTYIWKSFLLGCQSGIRFYLLYKISVLFRICTESSIFIYNVHFGFLSIFLSRLSSLICFSLELQFFNLFFSYVFLPLQVAEAFLVISYFICVFPQSIMRPFQSWYLPPNSKVSFPWILLESNWMLLKWSFFGSEARTLVVNLHF